MKFIDVSCDTLIPAKAAGENIAFRSGTGGKLIFRSGAGANTGPITPPMPCGDIVFLLGDSTECLRFEAGGRCFVRGELVETNADIWERFREWLSDAEVTSREKA